MRYTLRKKNKKQVQGSLISFLKLNILLDLYCVLLQFNMHDPYNLVNIQKPQIFSNFNWSTQNALLYIFLILCIYIYIYIERERERENKVVLFFVFHKENEAACYSVCPKKKKSKKICE